ncbi:serine threonine- kinase CDL1-like [Olea europaea subsp. europaea]|uniref:Serine threonine- kinase CDL1-like n=1 Tax=Olea europaea subsp. europaea TaxID=158383 RepID=A0A8S0PQZ4_OLEEU|nr:serine threonine- kinase CDL1-like [Olea europaea subsp. europaea]
MSCFSCVTLRRENDRDYDEDMTPKSVGSSESGTKGNSAGARGIDNNGQESNVARTFIFKELAMATQNFRESNLIGEGGFGSVYKGCLDADMASSVLPFNFNFY